MKRFVLALPLALVACSDTTTMAPARDGGDDLAPLDVPVGQPDVPDARADVTPDAPLPPDDVDPTCANGAVDRCLNHPPGPCPDLSDGVARTVRFTGFGHEHTVSCAGRMTGMGPDAVLPLTVRTRSDVSITAVPGTGDAVVVTLAPVDGCGVPERELGCVNGSNSIGGIGVLRVPDVAPGQYEVIVGTSIGAPVGVSAMLSPSRSTMPGDVCPGVTVTPDGDPVTIDTRRFFTTADYGTTCGYNGTRTLGWVDAVVNFTTREARDVAIEVSGDGEEDVNVELTRVCGVPAFTIPGCDSGNPARRTMHNLPAGTYWAVIDYKPTRRPDHTLSVHVTTGAPTPPGPEARCPGVALNGGSASVFDVDTLTPGPTLSCIAHPRASAFVTFEAPSTPGDVLVHVLSTASGSDAALALRSTCDGELVGPCVGPGDRSGNSAWARYRGLTPGQRYILQMSTSAAGGQLSARTVVVPAATPQAVSGNTTCDAAYVIPATGGIFTGNTDAATAVAMPFCASMTGCAGSRGVLYRLDLTERRRVVAVMRGTGFDTLLGFMTGDTCPGRNVRTALACNDDWYSTDSQVDATLDAGRYWIHAGGCGAMQSGTYQLDIAVIAPSG